MSRWFRMDDDVVNDPKVQGLPAEIFKAWVNVLCIASKNQGHLPILRDVAFLLRITEAKALELLTKLERAGLLDKDGDGFVPHNWNKRQFKSDCDSTNADRQKRYRSRHRNADSNVTHNVTDSEDGNVTTKRPHTETDTQTEKKEARAARTDDWPEDYREQFWAKYPNKVGKPAALAKLDAARKRGVPWLKIATGLDRYIATKPHDRAWLNPATFLNQDRYDDQPASLQAPQTFVENVEMEIESAVKMFAKTRVWSRWAGPEPGLSGCRASSDLLAKYGLAPDGRVLQTEVVT